MKKVICALLIGLSIASGGCRKFDKATMFEVDFNTLVTIENSAIIDLPFDILSPETTTNMETTLEVNDTRKDLIEEVVLRECVLTVEAPSGGDFSFLESIEIYMNADGLDEVWIAGKTEIPETIGGTLSLNVSEQDIQEYIKKEAFSIRCRVVTDEALGQDYTINVYTRVFVDAKILGQ